MMKKVLWSLLAVVVALAVLLYINPQIRPAHTEPYLSLGAESRAPAPESDQIIQRVLLYGDAGHSTTDPWQWSLAQIAARASEMPDRTVVVALGDNIYMRGFPQKKPGQQEWTDDQKESIGFLDAQLKIADVSGASLYVVPGNHDWLGKEVQSQALHVKAYAGEHHAKVYFEPNEADQLPLPESVDFPGVSLVFVDSQWWMNTDDQNKARAETAMAAQFARIRQTHPDNLIIIAQHHPLLTEGPHGGYLSDFRLWLIMNILYQVYPEAAAQDTSAPEYQQLIAAEDRVIHGYNKVIHAAGHDHNLQLMQPAAGTSADYLLVSGAGNQNKVSGVWHNGNTRFALSKEGFVELDVTASGVYYRAFSIGSTTPAVEFWLTL